MASPYWRNDLTQAMSALRRIDVTRVLLRIMRRDRGAVERRSVALALTHQRPPFAITEA